MAIRISAAPLSSNDSYTFAEGAGVNFSFNVRGNDGKSSGRPLYSLDNGQSADLEAADPVSSSASSLDRSALGAAIWINANGTVGYSTALIAARVESLGVGETLQDSFLYATRQSNGSLLWSTVRVTITGTNDAPVASNDSASAIEDVIATGSVATNDVDVDNGAVLAFAATSSAAGFAMNANGNWTLDASHQSYQDLAAGEIRQVVVAYRVTDQHGASSNASLTINVTGTNDRPVAAAATASASEDGTASGKVLATDADGGDSLTFALVGDAPTGITFAADGSWSFDGSAAAYQSLGAGETRNLLINYKATDLAGASSASTLTITITGVNDAPVAVAASAGVAEDGTAAGRLAATDADTTARLTYAVEGDAPAGLALAADGSWSFDANQAGLQSLAQGETADSIVTYRVTDEHGASSLSTLTLAVTGANDAPVTTSYAAEVTEGQSVVGQLMAIDQDTGAQLRFSAISRPPAGFSLATNGSWTLDANDAAYRALGAGEIQLVRVPFSVTDEFGARAESFITIAVTGIDEAPMLNGTPPALPPATEDTAFTVTQEQLLAGWSDPDGGSLTAFGVRAENAAVTENADGSFTVLPAANFNGTLQLSYDVSDGFRVAQAQRSLTVNAVNDNPSRSGIAYVIPTQTEDQGFTLTAAQLLEGWTDADGNALSVVGSFGGHGGTFADNGDGTYTFRPTPNDNGSGTIFYSVTDGTSVRSTFLHFYMTPVNDAAQVWGTGAGFITEDGAANVTGDLYAYDIDNELDSWSAVTSATPSSAGYGSFVIDAAGRWTYTLNNGHSAVNALATGQSLNDSFVVRTADGTEQTVTILINGATDFVYVSPPISTAADANDFDLLLASQTRASTLFNFYGTGANEQLHGSNGNDNMRGHGGADAIYGHGGSDSLYGELNTSNEPPLLGVAADDILYGQAGNDALYGGQGADTLFGGSGADHLYGNNSLGSNPETASNSLYGGSGDDRLQGDGGDDVLVGGTGADWLTGGGGADRFVFLGATDTGDWVFDFQRGSDKIDLSALGLDPAKFVGALPAAGMVGPGEVGFRIVKGGSQFEAFVYVDTDGVLGADLEIRIIGTEQFTSSDILW